ncbi:unnamed protein product, partial [Durusdinium trenchii]
MQILPLQCWREKCQSATSRGRRRRSATEGEAKLMTRSETFGDFWNFTLNPTGHFRNFWDFLAILCLVFDAIALPVQFVNHQFYATYSYSSIISRLQVFYWAFDLILSFFTGH